jgi:flagellar biosynthesis protein FliQ
MYNESSFVQMYQADTVVVVVCCCLLLVVVVVVVVVVVATAAAFQCTTTSLSNAYTILHTFIFPDDAVTLSGARQGQSGSRHKH